MKLQLAFTVFFFCFLTLTRLTEACGRGSIYLENNEYKKVLIAIGESVEENPTLIDKIKEAFTSASEALYKATKKRAFFQDVTILIPKTWPDNPQYQPIGRETPEKSDIMVDHPDPRFNSGNRPFVIKTTPCGEFGYYMHLTPEYILNSTVADQFGPYGKVLVHEWAHLRYGVFDEYPLEDGVHFYAGDDGEIEATRCGVILTGTIYNKDNGTDGCDFNGNLPEPSCRFKDFTDLSAAGDYASLMYRTNLRHVVEFCEDEDMENNTNFVHNGRAPNQQNNLCDGMSVWEVMRRNVDFVNDKNPPREINNLTPTFKLVRFKEKRTVLVLDVSGSMADNDRIGKLGQGCSSYISSIIEDGEYLGVVWFNATGYAIKEMTEVNDLNRPQLLAAIPRLARGGTSIGGGMRAALRMLERDGSTGGATLIVISDGEENARPYISEVANEIMNSNVVIHSIAITSAADAKVDALAEATGGLSYLYTAQDTSNALNEAFQEIGDLNTNPYDRHYQLVSKSEVLSSRAIYESSVILDPTLGRNSEFTFDYGGVGILVELIDPNGTIYDISSPECSHDSLFGIYRFIFDGQNEIGTWDFRVRNSDSRNQRVAISIKSKSYFEGEYPIITHAYWEIRRLHHAYAGRTYKQVLFVSVSKGYIPVLNADVVASIEGPNGFSFTLKMRDNGAGADTTKNDGIYTSYVTKYFGNGRYSAKINVNSNSSTVLSPSRIVGKGAPMLQKGAQYEADIPVDPFQRDTTAGSFELFNFTSGKVYPPGNITNLKVIAVDYDDQTVNLTWTAPGDELDVGTVSAYELRMSTDFKEMRNNFENQTLVTQDMITSGGNLLQPREAGEVEMFAVQVPTRGNISYTFAVTSIDSINQHSRRSNLVTASMRDFQGTTVETDEKIPVIAKDNVRAKITYGNLPTPNNVGVVLGAVVGTVVFVAVATVIVLAAFMVLKKKEKVITVKWDGRIEYGKENPVFQQ